MSEEIGRNQAQKDMASESALGYAWDDAELEQADKTIDYGFNGVDFGYARTIEEMDAALDEADIERNDPTKWITSVEFHTRIENKYLWLR